MVLSANFMDAILQERFRGTVLSANFMDKYPQEIFYRIQQCKFHGHISVGNISSNTLVQISWTYISRKNFIKDISANFTDISLQEIFHQRHQCKHHGHKPLGSFSSNILSAKFMAATLQEVFHQIHQCKFHRHISLGKISSKTLVQFSFDKDSRAYCMKLISANFITNLGKISQKMQFYVLVQISLFKLSVKCMKH